MSYTVGSWEPKSSQQDLKKQKKKNYKKGEKSWQYFTKGTKVDRAHRLGQYINQECANKFPTFQTKTGSKQSGSQQ